MHGNSGPSKNNTRDLISVRAICEYSGPGMDYDYVVLTGSAEHRERDMVY